MFAAVGSAALSVYAGRHYLGAREIELQAEARAGLEGRPVVVAARTLEVGTRIVPGDLAVRQVPARFADSGSLDPDSAGRLLGQRVLRTRRNGDVVTPGDVDASGREALASRLEPGTRAVTMPVDELGSIAGLVQPGDRVDLFYLPAAGVVDGRISLLLPQVKVLATGSRMQAQSVDGKGSPEHAGFASITVALSLEDAGRLALAQRAGQVVPVLRREGELGSESGISFTTSALLRHDRSAVNGPRQKASEAPRLEIIVGGRGEAVASVDALTLPPAQRLEQKQGGL
jgi:pilus assembly protein CpaB